MQDAPAGVPESQDHAESDAEEARVMFRERSRVLHTQFERLARPKASLVEATFVRDVPGETSSRICTIQLPIEAGGALSVATRATDEMLHVGNRRVWVLRDDRDGWIVIGPSQR